MNAQPLAYTPAPAATPAPAPLVLVVSDGRFGYCDTCAAETIFERPLCVDGHGDLCAEWVCTDCGTAVIVEIGVYLEPLSVEPAVAVEPVRSIAGSSRVNAA